MLMHACILDVTSLAVWSMVPHTIVSRIRLCPAYDSIAPMTSFVGKHHQPPPHDTSRQNINRGQRGCCCHKQKSRRPLSPLSTVSNDHHHHALFQNVWPQQPQQSVRSFGPGTRVRHQRWQLPSIVVAFGRNTCGDPSRLGTSPPGKTTRPGGHGCHDGTSGPAAPCGLPNGRYVCPVGTRTGVGPGRSSGRVVARALDATIGTNSSTRGFDARAVGCDATAANVVMGYHPVVSLNIGWPRI